MQVSGGSQSFNAVNQMRVLGRWMRMITIPNQSSVAMAYKEFDDDGRMKPSAYYDRVVDVIRERPRWNAVHRALLDPAGGRALLVVTLLRVPPTSPFALANFVLAAGRVRLGAYALGTLIGIAPRTALAVTAAAGLEQLQFKTASSTAVVVAGIAATLVACVVLGWLANRELRRVTSGGATG